MLRTVEQNPSDLIVTMADMARARVTLSGAFLAELTRHIQGQSPHFTFVHSWLQHRLAEEGATIEQLVRIDGQARAADQVSMGNSIGSLRRLVSSDWRDFVEAQSAVERVLRQDPTGVYATMDFTTRDRCRHAIEDLAKQSGRTEVEVATAALARRGDADPERRDAHISYHLLDAGRTELERLLHVRTPLRTTVVRALARRSLAIYLSSAAALVAIAIVLLGRVGGVEDVRALWLWLLAIPAVVCLSQASFAIVNWIATLSVPPRPLPRMDFRRGIPEACRTLVAVPTMLVDRAGVERLLESLEVLYLANRDPMLHFALLTDLRDGPHELSEVDAELVQLAARGVAALNAKYRTARSDIFALLHRPRRWNAREGHWMGHERKRGKIHDLNAWLRGAAAHDLFATIVGETAALQRARYVITLDTDTQLPRDAARRMVETMAHPLNRPVVRADADGSRARVVAGYGIVQPRVGVSLPSSQRSHFVRLACGDAGIDPYTRMVSDVYQDLFDEGTFIGKGIYGIDAFVATCGAFPDDTILSHDLLESTYARSGLLSDVELYEDFPSRYLDDASRRERWVRGDWQILWWLLPYVPSRASRWVRNPISTLSRWKILDNLRRSVVPIAMVALLVAAWIGVPSLAPAATIVVLATLAIASALGFVGDVVTPAAELPVRARARAAGATLGHRLLQGLLALVVLPHDAWINLSALTKTLVRMFVTRRHLLEWTTAGDIERRARDQLSGYLRAMWCAPALALGVAAACLFVRPESLPWAMPFLAPWFLAPVAAWWISRPRMPERFVFSASQRAMLERLSRRTWSYFERYVNAEEHWLPPDNVQTDRPVPVASRTSPTNIGLALLSDLAAADFGYVSRGRMLQRISNTLDTVAGLDRHRGHLYNWYDTRSLRPMPPFYVSTVDSGNFAGHLHILKSGLLGLIDAPIVPARLFGGLRATVEVLLDEIRPDRTTADLIARLARLSADLMHESTTTRGALERLGRMAQRSVALAFEIERIPDVGADAIWWATALARACADHRDDLQSLTSWTSIAGLPVAADEADAPEEPRTEAYRAILARLDRGAERAVTLRELAMLAESETLAVAPAPGAGGAVECAWATCVRERVLASARAATARISQLTQAAARCEEAGEMDFTFLFDPERELFAIGYGVNEHRLDAAFYDLLASEARFASFVAIARGQVGQESWFALGRLLTTTGSEPALLSWSGSMFEYLMPLLVMPSFPGTLLDHTYRAVVQRQITYARRRDVPWGMSESGYFATDAHLNYQYRAFGVPGLGLKRGLADDIVVAPYATALALMVDPDAACRNFARLSELGAQGACGLYEAIDFTPSRLPRRATHVVVRQFMAHHQGMSLLAFDYALLDRPMQRRFNADPALRASVHLLQERVPRALSPIFPHAAEASATRPIADAAEGSMRIFDDPVGGPPEVGLLSNGRYHVVVTNSGGGYSRWRDIEITRWQEDATRDCWGTFCYLRDIESGETWSTSWQPGARPSGRYEAIFTQARAEFRRVESRIETHAEISVSPEDDVELRRVTITNRSDTTRTIEFTSYAEIVLAPAGQDAAHRAFSNLFVQTELVRRRQAILCTRRPRSAEERPPWLMHLLSVRGTTVGAPSFETDRGLFLGRGRDASRPSALDAIGPLSDSSGAVLDPIVAIRHTARLAPNESVIVDFVTGIAETRAAVEAMTERYCDPRLADRIFDLATTHSQILLRQLNVTEQEAECYEQLAGSIVFASGLRRAKPSVLTRNRRGQSGLWSYGISGDIPIVLVRIRDAERLELMRQAVKAHAYWRMRGLPVDLVIWNEDSSVYHHVLQQMIVDVVGASTEAALLDKPGGIFVRRGEQMSDEDRALLQTVARVVLFDEAGTLEEQAARRDRTESFIPALQPSRSRREAPRAEEPPTEALRFFNGLGGFRSDGREYVVRLQHGARTPAPWSNVIANAQFGTLVSESGGSYTWWGNSHEFRLTPWRNDPVSDVSGEAIYLRDEETARVWTPTPLPSGRGHAANAGAASFTIRHGFGYSAFEHTCEGISTELRLYVAADAPVKVARLRVVNASGRPRRLSVTGYWELVLGDLRAKTLMHVATELDPTTGAIFARNPYSAEFADRLVFVDCSEPVRTVTGDRTEFLGRNGESGQPAALRRVRLSGRLGAGFDPCAAMQAPIELEDGEEREVVFVLGVAASEDEARRLMRRFRSVSGAQRAFEAVAAQWTRTLGALEFETPDPAVDVMANGWLLYQTISCRLWGRTGFYQSGGAFGFRDQLQDVMALLHAEPLLCREHLVRCAAHQFEEGDVQHWWHPPIGRGVRTRISDDYLWLPAAVCRYVATTGDTGVLDVEAPYLKGRPLRPEEDSYFDLPQRSERSGSLYEHCVAAIDHGLRTGEHGLPLMGSGDWNDGMNLVGARGKGESVWLAFFLVRVLADFEALARKRGDEDTARRCHEHAETLRRNVEMHGWDGDWYRRAYFDDGEPLGSRGNDECQIDAVAQSWAVLSGASAPERARSAMDHAIERLVGAGDRAGRRIRLLDPPFDRGRSDPGYIKGYVPGVRENGGQYNHAALWTLMACAALGDADLAWELLALVNPVTLGMSPDAIATYRVEPYVLAADIYTVAPHTGRGGWTWYTGSAGVMYRLLSESLLGVRVEVDRLRVAPRMPAGWSGFRARYRFRETTYTIDVRRTGPGANVVRVSVDGVDQPSLTVTLTDDRAPHAVVVDVA
ncbi:MAG: cyclic beta 1-2 glucan synthetase [Phycisphaerae bacterium]|nr:cyclic beta 1-2 glucan synthetase [Phycisphaerae bacterium]